MKSSRLLALAVSAACLSTTTPLLAADDSSATAITIYSSAQPGAIPPELYRPLPGQEKNVGQNFLQRHFDLIHFLQVRLRAAIELRPDFVGAS